MICEIFLNNLNNIIKTYNIYKYKLGVMIKLKTFIWVDKIILKNFLNTTFVIENLYINSKINKNVKIFYIYIL